MRMLLLLAALLCSAALAGCGDDDFGQDFGGPADLSGSVDAATSD